MAASLIAPRSGFVFKPDDELADFFLGGWRRVELGIEGAKRISEDLRRILVEDEGVEAAPLGFAIMYRTQPFLAEEKTAVVIEVMQPHPPIVARI